MTKQLRRDFSIGGGDEMMIFILQVGHDLLDESIHLFIHYSQNVLWQPDEEPQMIGFQIICMQMEPV